MTIRYLILLGLLLGGAVIGRQALTARQPGLPYVYGTPCFLTHQIMDAEGNCYGPAPTGPRR